MGKRDTGKWDIGRMDIIRNIKKLVGETGHLFSGNWNILLSGNRNTYPLGIGPLILWIRDILWETGHAILWDSDHLFSGKVPLEIGNLGDEVQPW